MGETGQQSRPGGVSLRRRFLSAPTVLSVAIAAALVTLLAVRFDLDWGRTWEVVRQANPWWFALAFLVHYTTFIFRGARWRVLLVNVTRDDQPPTPVPSTLHCGAIILMGWFANSVTWFRLGDAYRAYTYAEETDTSFSRAMGTVVADRAVDVAVVFVMIVAAATAMYVGGQVRPSPLFVVVAAALLAAILSGLAAMFLLRRWVAPRFPSRLEEAYHRFHAGTMGSFKRLHLVFLLGVLGWFSEVGRLFLVVHALGAPVAIALVLFVPLANGLLTAVPLTPGGLGIVETGITGLLTLSLVREEALAVVLLDRSISYVSIVVSGGLLFALRQARMAKRANVR